jgi:DNA-binding CsgD family transcriptional regulator
VMAAADPLLASGRASDARALLLGALGDADAVGPERALELLAQVGLNRALDRSGGEEVVARLRASLPQLDGSTPARRYAAGALALLAVLCDGTAGEALGLARRALASEASIDEDARAGRPQYVTRVALALAGEPEEALTGLERALGFSASRGSVMGQGVGLGWRALIHALAGNVGETENDARASLAVLAGTGLSGPELGASAALAWALNERGELAEADEVLAAAPPEHGWGGAAVACVRARLLMARHRYAEALVELAAVRAIATEAGWRSLQPVDWRSLEAYARLGTGDAEGALHLAGEDVAAAERFGSARELGRALRIRGLVAGPEAQLSAIACLRAAGSSLELARALVDHGAALRRAGDRARSREPLLEGLERAAACGANVLVEQARTELRAAGARPRRVARSGVESLTPSERRVAGLAADGLSNAEVAQALFVTVRTVEMHLSAAYRKLEISSRAALPGALSA